MFNMSAKDIHREISANQSKHFIVIYYSLNSIMSSISSLESCVKDAMNYVMSHNCTGENVLPCIDVVLSKLSACQEQAYSTVAKAMQDLVYSPLVRYNTWFKTSYKDKGVADKVEKQVIPHLDVAYAILWFLVSNARLFFREDLPEYVALIDEIVIENLKEPIIKLLGDQGVVVTTGRDFYTTSVLVRLLDNVIRELHAAGTEAANIISYLVRLRTSMLAKIL